MPMFKSLFSKNCSDILQKGPGIVAQGCEDVLQANIIFSEALEGICNVTVPEEIFEGPTFDTGTTTEDDGR